MESAPIIRSIVDMGTVIHQAVSTVQENRKICQRLDHRIQWIIRDIQQLTRMSESTLFVPSLERFQKTLDYCLRFVGTFKNASLASTAWSNQSYQFILIELNQRLTDHVLDLNLTCQINAAVNGRQTRDDRMEKSMEQTLEVADSDQSAAELQQQLLDATVNEEQSRTLSELDSAGHPGSNIRILASDLQVEQYVGRGTFGDVYRGKWLNTNRQVAIKVVRPDGDLQESAEHIFMQEIANLCDCRCENVLPVLGACISLHFRLIILEYMPFGSLHDLLHRADQQIDWPDRWSIALQMCQGLDYLHRVLHITHGAVKSSNFLVDIIDSKYVIKLSDFGLEQTRQQSSRHSHHGGGLQYQAPELLLSLDASGYSPASDVYALAIVLWELATLSLPSRNTDLSVLSNLAISGIRMHIPSSVPALMTEIITSAWNQNPNERPSCDDLVKKITHFLDPPVPSEPTVPETNGAANGTQRSPLSEGRKKSFGQLSNTSAFAAAKSKNRKLVEKIANLPSSFMDLRRSSITDEDIPFVVERALVERRAIYLLLTDNKLTAEGVKILVEKLNELETDASRLHSLDLSGNSLEDEVTAHLAQLFDQSDTKLSHLRLERVRLTDQGVHQLSAAVSESGTLTKLYLNENKSITDASVDSLIQMLNTLNRLEVANCGLSTEGQKRLQEAAALRKKLKLIV